MSACRKRIIITGLPGVGKTTLVRKAVDHLRKISSHPLIGFYTQEVKERGQRMGFDIVSVTGERAVLARKSESNESPAARGRPCMVGSYQVHRDEFEKLALACLNYKQGEQQPVVIIDEIGKMEMFSIRFIDRVREIFSDPAATIIATVPSKPLPFVEEIRSGRNTIQFVVTQQNRNDLLTEIVSAIEKNT